VTVTEPRVGIRDLEITGVGPLTSGAEEVPGASIAEDAWDDKFMTYYTGADAAISARRRRAVGRKRVNRDAVERDYPPRESRYCRS